MNSKRSGSCHLAKSCEVFTQFVRAESVPSRSAITASGRSPQRSSGTAMTAACATAGWAMSWFSRSTEEIHSPPDFTRSLDRSQIRMQPSLSMRTMSPVLNQPSGVKLAPPGRGGSRPRPRAPDLEFTHGGVVPGDELALVIARADLEQRAGDTLSDAILYCSSASLSSRLAGNRHTEPSGAVSVIPQACITVRP